MREARALDLASRRAQVALDGVNARHAQSEMPSELARVRGATAARVEDARARREAHALDVCEEHFGRARAEALVERAKRLAVVHRPDALVDALKRLVQSGSFFVGAFRHRSPSLQSEFRNQLTPKRCGHGRYASPRWCAGR